MNFCNTASNIHPSSIHHPFIICPSFIRYPSIIYPSILYLSFILHHPSSNTSFNEHWSHQSLIIDSWWMTVIHHQSSVNNFLSMTTDWWWMTNNLSYVIHQINSSSSRYFANFFCFYWLTKNFVTSYFSSSWIKHVQSTGISLSIGWRYIFVNRLATSSFWIKENGIYGPFLNIFSKIGPANFSPFSLDPNTNFFIKKSKILLVFTCARTK